METKPKSRSVIEHTIGGLYFSLLIQGMIAVFLLLALNYDQGETAIFLLIIILSAIALRLWSRLSPKSLIYKVSLEKRKVFPGETVLLTIVVANNKLLPVLVRIRMMVDRILTSETGASSIKEDDCILWFQQIEFQHELKPSKRGVYQTGSPRLTTGDFFGFFPRQTGEKQSVEILVYPKLVPLKSFPILSLIIFGKPAPVSPIYDPLYILGTQDYQSFSPAKNIHWKASARHHKIQEKVFEAAEQEKILIILEAAGFIHADDEDAFEKAIEAIASLSIELNGQFYAVGFLTDADKHGDGTSHLKPGRESSHIPQFLETLSKLKFTKSVSMEQILSNKEVFPVGVTCICFSFHPLPANHRLFGKKIPLVNIVANLENTQESFQSTTARTYSLNDLYTEI